MTNTEAVTVLQSCLAFAVLYIFWVFCWKQYALDKFRQDLFAIRDDMFLDIAKGKAPLTFGSPEYAICRRDLNQMIRCAPTVNLTGLVTMITVQKFCAPGYTFEDFAYSESVIDQSSDQKIKDFVQIYQERLNDAALRFLLTGSLGFVWFAAATLVLFIIVGVVRALVDFVRKSFAVRVLMRMPSAIYESIEEEVRLTEQWIVQLILLSETKELRHQ
jgi:hypothetical protein